MSQQRIAIIVKLTAAWLAGVNRMPWKRFPFWNALGGITWASSIGVAAYFLGKAAAVVLGTVGLAVLGLLVLAAVGVLLARSLHRPRAATALDPSLRPGTEPPEGFARRSA
jgi:membrane protein DedA with SNARE-associated domain